MEQGIPRLEVTDFMLGVLNAADEHHYGLTFSCRDRSVDAAFADASKHLLHLIDAGIVPAMNVRFRIAPHPIHGDSPTVFDTMCFLSSLDYIRQPYPGSPYYYFNRDPHKHAREFHDKKLRAYAGPFETYQRLAGRFVTIVTGGTVEEISPALSVEPVRALRP